MDDTKQYDKEMIEHIKAGDINLFDIQELCLDGQISYEQYELYTDEYAKELKKSMEVIAYGLTKRELVAIKECIAKELDESERELARQLTYCGFRRTPEWIETSEKVFMLNDIQDKLEKLSQDESEV